VIGVKDEVRGEVPKAFVIAREGIELDEKELRTFCRENLAGYKVPKYIEVVADLPRSPTGKVLSGCFPGRPETVAAVCDRRRCRKFKIAGGHRPPLQWMRC